PLANLRAAYQQISKPDVGDIDVTASRKALEVVRAMNSLTPRDREEVDLIDGKIDMRDGDPHQPELLHRATTKLAAFLRTARTPELRSEARGWIAHIDYLLGDQTAAGKIYLDELNRN